MTRRLAVLAGVAALVAACAGLGTTAVAVAATDWRPVPETGAPGRLVLYTGPEPLALPGAGGVTETVWQVRTDVETAEDGRPEPVTLDLEVRKDGALAREPGGLRVAVSSCDREWTAEAGGPVCPTGAVELVSAGPADDWSVASPVASPIVRIPDADGDGTAYLLVRSTLADPGAVVPAGAVGPDGRPEGRPDGRLDGRLGVGVTARSHGPAASPSQASVLPTVLAWTGGGFAGPVLVGLAAVLAGAALRLRRNDRNDRDDREGSA